MTKKLQPHVQAFTETLLLRLLFFFTETLQCSEGYLVGSDTQLPGIANA